MLMIQMMIAMPALVVMKVAVMKNMFLSDLTELTWMIFWIKDFKDKNSNITYN